MCGLQDDLDMQLNVQVYLKVVISTDQLRYVPVPLKLVKIWSVLPPKK